MTSGNRNAPPEQGSWNLPGATPAYPPAAGPGDGGRLAGRGRPGVVALVVVLVELIVIAAVGNQAVTKHTVRYGLDHQTSFLGRAVQSSTTLGWRFSPAGGDNRDGFHFLYSQLLFLAVFVVLSALIAALTVRGPVTFWRAFVGIWTGVLFAACVAKAIGPLATRPLEAHVDRPTNAVFLSISSLTVFTGVALGLLTALIAALFALSTRRAATAPAATAPGAPEPAYVPETPPPFYGNAPAGDAYGRDPRAENDTMALPSLGKDDPAGPRPDQDQAHAQAEPDNRTTQLPRSDPRGGQNWTPPDDGQATQALPTGPDDERR